MKNTIDRANVDEIQCQVMILDNNIVALRGMLKAALSEVETSAEEIEAIKREVVQLEDASDDDVFTRLKAIDNSISELHSSYGIKMLDLMHSTQHQSTQTLKKINELREVFLENTHIQWS